MGLAHWGKGALLALALSVLSLVAACTGNLVMPDSVPLPHVRAEAGPISGDGLHDSTSAHEGSQGEQGSGTRDAAQWAGDAGPGLTVFFAEDWEHGTPPPCWPAKTWPGTCCDETFNEWQPSDWACGQPSGNKSGLSTTHAHSGQRSYYQNANPNAADTVDLVRKIKPTPPYPTKIHVRFYIRFESAWTGFDAPTTLAPFIHLFFTNTARSGTGFRVNLIDWNAPNDPWPCSCNCTDPQPRMFAACENDADGCGAGTAAYDCYDLRSHLEEWISLEFMIDYDRQRYAVWINGDQKVGVAGEGVDQEVTADLPAEEGGGHGFYRLIFSGYSSPDVPTWERGFYLDDIVVADGYIGP